MKNMRLFEFLGLGDPSVLPSLGEHLTAERRRLLDQLADAIAGRVGVGQPAQLTFICTHNSRRSHFGQVWMQVAAAHFGFAADQIACFSGGTEATACHPNTIASMGRVGFQVDRQQGDSANPVYQVGFRIVGRIEGGVSTSDEVTGTGTCFSKKFDSPENPAKDFIAVMCCGSAAEACPVVPGAAFRVAVTYDDPKAADGTPQEAETYDARSRQIGREMFYVMQRVADQS